MSTAAARLVVLLPALAAAVGLVVARRGAAPARLVAVGGAALTLAAALVGLLAVSVDARHRTAATLPALAAGELDVPLLLQTGRLPALVAVVVGVVGWAVQAFAAWYLRADDRYGVFAATVSLFCAGMLLVVHSADLLLTFVGWEVMGWCSYLLIGHWSRKESARRAALKAFLVTRLADVGFLLGVVILAAGAGTTAYPQVVEHWTTAESAAARSAAMVLLVIGVLGKSAQFPFHDWLPDAMEGPTPASALIHAATMVAAGTFVLASLFEVLAASEAARWVLALSTAVTMVGAAALAFGQRDLKRLLAYSTVSQVALMLSALSVAPADEGPGAGVLHLYGHAFFKALLFLVIGWLSVLAGGTAAAALRGSLGRQALLRGAALAGLLSLAGVPPLVGFVSKEHVLAAAEAGAFHGEARSVLVLIAGLATVALTAAYCMRAWLVLDARPAGDGLDPSGEAAVPGAGTAATTGARAAVALLAAVTVVGGLVVLTPLPMLRGHVTWWMAVVTVLLLAGAALLVRRAGAGGDPADRLPARRLDLADSGLGADRLYVRAVAVPVLALARLTVFLDREVVDAYVRGGAAAAGLGGRGGRRIHAAERAATSLVWVVLGVLGLALAGVALW
jgi:NADH-quinone oxidoreductase subunit L